MTKTTAFVNICVFFHEDSGDRKKKREEDGNKKKRVTHTNTPAQAYAD